MKTHLRPWRVPIIASILIAGSLAGFVYSAFSVDPVSALETVPYFVFGLGLLRGRNWARVLLLWSLPVAAAVAILNGNWSVAHIAVSAGAVFLVMLLTDRDALIYFRRAGKRVHDWELPENENIFACSECEAEVSFGASQCSKCGQRFRYGGGRLLEGQASA